MVDEMLSLSVLSGRKKYDNDESRFFTINSIYIMVFKLSPIIMKHIIFNL
jgi:hypothetical protein